MGRGRAARGEKKKKLSLQLHPGSSRSGHSESLSLGDPHNPKKKNPWGRAELPEKPPSPPLPAL
eukprot:15475846-Alexandrium_andersonii.AAC.1